MQSLIKYCKRDDPQIRKWAVEYEEAYGTQMFEMVQDWRSQPSPPHLHQHVHSSQPQVYHQQPQAAHNNGNHHSTAYHAQQLSLSHRRLSDVRTSGPPQGPFTLNNPRSPHHHASDSYGSNGSSSSTVKRSPSHSPPISYPLGGRASNTATSSSSSSSNSARPLAPGLHDARGGQSGAGMGVPAGSGGEAALFQAQPAAAAVGTNKYGSRDAGHQGGAPGALRWAHMGDDSPGGGGADAGMQGAGAGPVGTGMSGDGKGGSTAGDSGGAGAARGFGAPGDGTQSLPSLKASGLLDSWGSASRAAGAADAQKAAPGAQQTPRRNAPSGGMHLTLLTGSQHAADVAELRPSTTLGMPVGMSWLANESR